MNKMLYLIRGLPGSGKSTFAGTLANSLSTCGRYCFHFEADQYFMRDGEYQFERGKIHGAHLWCQRMVEDKMIRQDENIVVSNTSTTEKELRPYLDLAEKYGYHVTTLIVENRRDSKSIHDVPDITIENMRNRFSIKL